MIKPDDILDEKETFNFLKGAKRIRVKIAMEEFAKRKLEEAKDGQHETIVIPQDDCEKQAWFIITVMRNMNKDEVEMLCKNLLARFDIDLGKLIQDVNQIKDEKLTI